MSDILLDEQDMDIITEGTRPTKDGYWIKGGGNNQKFVHWIVAERMGLVRSAGLFVDHINRNPADNRRANIRLATKSQNAVNSKLRKTNTSGYRGVCYHKQNKRWLAQVTVNKKTVCCGTHKTKEEAALAYNAAAKHHHGEFAALNKI